MERIKASVSPIKASGGDIDDMTVVRKFAFEAKLSLKEKSKKSKAIQSGSEEETEEISDSDLEIVEALLAKKFLR